MAKVMGARHGKKASKYTYARRKRLALVAALRRRRKRGRFTATTATLLGAAGLAAIACINPVAERNVMGPACTELSGHRATESPLKAYAMPPGGLASKYIEAEKLYRQTAQKLGRQMPDYLNATFMGRVGHLESTNGTNAY